MTDILPLSVFIIACNEEDRIAHAIKSVDEWVDEIIVVDSGSKDQTPKIAGEHGANVYYHPWVGYGPQKRYGEDHCRNDWILNIDADEAITPALRDEILSLFKSSDITTADFWSVNILNVWAHERKPAPYAYGYKQIRLYRKSIGRFSQSPVHDTVRPPENARLRHLNAPMEHRSIRSLEFQVDKMNRYSSVQVKDLQARGRPMPRYRLLTELPLAFLKAYILRKYALYGWWGVIVSVNYALSRYLRIAKSFEADMRTRSPRTPYSG
ncbi:glycosyltransferase family 2 protein [Flexibacterium corallicola]|uniref:glycosyltransferase family 2 protein n=1 Tax=Flexibacterium corallicola TaxID=3037259 RepID=UPI00286ED1F9|nr:glycosyltransferase family 2 protein [Pseudovibrio sp. M1P-2-3]